MAETVYGVRKYTCSDKTKRPQKKKVDLEKLEKRNTNQRRLYITLENIDEIFSDNDDKYPICYSLIFNLIQGKVTKYFNTRSYDRKKELSYDAMNVLYSTLKRKLLRMKDAQGLLNPPPVLFFYVSQFYRYVELVVYSIVHYGTVDTKYLVQEPDNFKTDEVAQDDVTTFFYQDDSLNKDSFIENSLSEEFYYKTDENISLNADKIKKCIEDNKKLNEQEKNVMLKIYKNSYSDFGCKSLTKRENDILLSIQNRMLEDNTLLSELKEILNG